MLNLKKTKSILFALPLLFLLGCEEELASENEGDVVYFFIAADGRYWEEGTMLDANGNALDPNISSLPLVESITGLFYPPFTQLNSDGSPVDPSIASLDYVKGADGRAYLRGTELTSEGSPVSTDQIAGGGSVNGTDGSGEPSTEPSCPLMCEVEVITQETVEVDGIGCTADPYLAGESYSGGATVSFESKTYTARWWTNYSPTSAPDGAWGDGVPCGDTGLVTRPVTTLELVCCESDVEGPEEPTPEFECILDKHLTRDTFNSWFSGRAASKYNTFYTYDNLCEALETFSDFANTGDDAADKREIAAFFANVARETGELQFIEEISQTVPTYYGRGPIQLTHIYNYAAAGAYIGESLESNPGLVSSDGVISWKTGLWFWMAASGAGKGTCHDGIHAGGGLGKTIDIINGGYECRGSTPAAQERIGYFEKYIGDLGVDAGGPKTCW